MNKIYRIFIILFIVIFFVLTSAYVYLCFKGKDLVVQRLEQQIGRKVSFGAVSFSYPLVVKIKQLSVEGYGSAKQAIFSLNFFYLFLGEVHFDHVEIVEPYILFTRQGNEKISLVPALASSPKKEAADAALTPAQPRNTRLVLFANKVVIRDGTFMVFESLGNEAKALAQVTKINAVIGHAVFPVEKPVKTTFHLKALVSGFEGRLASEALSVIGWADFYQKDMLAQAKLTGINGQVGLSAELESVKNDMTVKGKMSLSFKTKTSPGQETKNFEDLFVQALQSSGTNIDLSFQFKTKMDDFKANKISLSGAVTK